MKKKFLFMLLITIYLIQFLLIYIMSPFLLFIKTTLPPFPASKYLLVALFVLSFILIAVNIATALGEMKRSGDNQKNISLGAIMGFKIAFIPFFIGHIFWFLLAMGGTANPFLFILWIFIPPIFLFYAYIMVLATSSYLIAQINVMRKNGMFTKRQCTFHSIMQLLFFIDVIDSVYLFLKYKKSSEQLLGSS